MAKHFGSVDRQRGLVELDFQLVVDSGELTTWNARPSVRVTAAPGALGKRERAINLKLSLPIALFVAPSITARIEVADGANPVTIDASAISEAVRGVIGADVRVEVVPPAINRADHTQEVET